MTTTPAPKLMPELPQPGQKVLWRNPEHARAWGWKDLFGPGSLFVNVGERTNVTGSAQFKKLIKEDRYDEHKLVGSHFAMDVLEGIHARYLMGKTVGEGFDHIGSLVEIMVQGALDQCSRSSIAALRG